MKKVFYNEFMLDEEQLQDIDILISEGLRYEELENEKYSHMLAGNKEQIEDAKDILSY